LDDSILSVRLSPEGRKYPAGKRPVREAFNARERPLCACLRRIRIAQRIRNARSDGFLPRHFQGRSLRTFQHAETEPKWPVYHFVYHCNREVPLVDANTLSGQKQNPLI
jgi:hypothetical protein